MKVGMKTIEQKVKYNALETRILIVCKEPKFLVNVIEEIRKESKYDYVYIRQICEKLTKNKLMERMKSGNQSLYVAIPKVYDEAESLWRKYYKKVGLKVIEEVS